MEEKDIKIIRKNLERMLYLYHTGELDLTTKEYYEIDEVLTKLNAIEK